MKIYHITFRHSTVVDTISVTASSAKRARRYAAQRMAHWPQASIYRMWRVF